MKRAIYPGTFDPFTKGHEDILKRALKVFDEIPYSGVQRNTERKFRGNSVIRQSNSTGNRNKKKRNSAEIWERKFRGNTNCELTF